MKRILLLLIIVVLSGCVEQEITFLSGQFFNRYKNVWLRYDQDSYVYFDDHNTSYRANLSEDDLYPNGTSTFAWHWDSQSTDKLILRSFNTCGYSIGRGTYKVVNTSGVGFKLEGDGELDGITFTIEDPPIETSLDRECWKGN